MLAGVWAHRIRTPKPRPKPGGGKGAPASHPSGKGWGLRTWDANLHPRDAHGHWITTTGGTRRIREGTSQQRKALAAKIRKQRKGIKGKADRRKLAHQVRQARADRRSKPATLDQRRRAWADDHERKLAGHVGGKQLEDYQPHDVLAPKASGKGDHAIEVKTRLDAASKKELSVHENALLRKVDDAAANPNRVYHTVVFDTRAGHEQAVYYRRASGKYVPEKMYKVKDPAELKRLLEMPNHQLPEAARGEFPKGEALAHLRQVAEKEREYNNMRSKARKAKLGKAAYGRAE